MKKLLALSLIAALAALAGCGHPGKMRDLEVKGMYVNGYSETLAIGAGRITSIPGEREALAARYEEDTAWLSPNIKTHKIDIFLVGSNTVSSADEIIGSICKAFSDVAPSVAATNAEAAKASSAPTPLGVIKAGGEVRKTAEAAKAEVAKAEVAKVKAAASSAASTSADPHCADGSCSDSATCPDCEAK